MTHTEREFGEVTVIDIDGRVTIQDGADEFREVARELIRNGRVRLVLNMKNVPYIDSTALGEIIRTYTSVTRHNGSLKLLNVSSHVHQLLVITSLLSVFDLFDAEEEAVKSFGHPRAAQH